MAIVDISWNERRKVIFDRKSYEYLLDSQDDELLDQCGFYCIYGHHPLYGADVLLYIGETKKGKSGNRCFRDRLVEHFSGRFWNHQNLWFSTGTASKPLEDAQVRAVESLLIAAHKPALNRHHLDKPLKEAKELHVRNWDFTGALQFECSGRYWLS